ncbi:MAG TPA: flagellar hook-length control protein FliK [Chloroflexota bacterium]|nr:flagellar hook-length control protein FliK [Chloroflexota bacterium]
MPEGVSAAPRAPTQPDRAAGSAGERVREPEADSSVRLLSRRDSRDGPSGDDPAAVAGGRGLGAAPAAQGMPADAAPREVEVRLSPASSLPEQVALGLEVAARDAQAVRLHLQPEGLGNVLLHVARGEQGLSVQLVADSAATRDLLQATVAQLTQTLDQRGLSVAQVLVSLAGGGAGASGDSPGRATAAPVPRRSGPRATSAAPASAVAALARPLHRIDYRV